MTPALGFGAIDDSDETFEARLLEKSGDEPVFAFPQVEQEARHSTFMAQPLIAFRDRRLHRLDLHRRVPFVRGGDRSRVGSESYRLRLFTESLLGQLADVQLAATNSH